MMRVQADAGRCVGAGQCVMTASAVFDQDDGGTVVLLDPTPPAEAADAVREAEYLCPASAITVTAGPA